MRSKDENRAPDDSTEVKSFNREETVYPGNGFIVSKYRREVYGMLSKHLIHTWLFANGLHAVCFIVYLRLVESPGLATTQFLAGLLYFFWVSLVLSFPCLFIGGLCLLLVHKTPHRTQDKFILWLLVAPSLAFCECMVVMNLINAADCEIIPYAVSATFATVFVIITRKRSFQQHVESQSN